MDDEARRPRLERPIVRDAAVPGVGRGGVDQGATVAAERPHDHPVLGEDARVLQLPLVGVAERHVGRADQASIGPDGEQAKYARFSRVARQGGSLPVFSSARRGGILATMAGQMFDYVTIFPYREEWAYHDAVVGGLLILGDRASGRPAGPASLADGSAR